jgi:hypothetical protein
MVCKRHSAMADPALLLALKPAKPANWRRSILSVLVGRMGAHRYCRELLPTAELGIGNDFTEHIACF